MTEQAFLVLVIGVVIVVRDQSGDGGTILRRDGLEAGLDDLIDPFPVCGHANVQSHGQDGDAHRQEPLP